MSTENMPEDELDDLFRRAASGYHPEFDPEAWQAMEKKLDAQFGAPAPAAKTNWWRLSGLILLILFTGIGVWVGYNQLGPNKATTQAAQPILPANTANNAQEKLNGPVPAATKHNNVNSDKTNTAQTVATNNADQSTNAAQATALNKVGLPSTSTKVERSLTQKPAVDKQVTRFSAKLGNRNQVSSLIKANLATGTGDKAEQQHKTEIVKTDTQLAAETGTATPTLKAAVPAPDSAGKLAEPGQPLAPDSSLVKAGSAPSLPDSATAKKRPKRVALNRFTISVMAAPDLSTVGFVNPGGISTNAGVMLGYSLNHKWSLATGIVKARKIYDAKPDDYGSANYWYNRHKPDDISAVCQVIDIPVNIGYNIWQKNKSVFGVQTGLSSYLMLNEEYAYEYKPYGGKKGYTSYYEINNKNRHLFSIYNLSGRYSHYLTRSVIAGVEPFVKVPLAGVGAGKVKLASAGVFFSLSYRYPQ